MTQQRVKKCFGYGRHACQVVLFLGRGSRVVRQFFILRRLNCTGNFSRCYIPILVVCDTLSSNPNPNLLPYSSARCLRERIDLHEFTHSPKHSTDIAVLYSMCGRLGQMFETSKILFSLTCALRCSHGPLLLLAQGSMHHMPLQQQVRHGRHTVAFF